MAVLNDKYYSGEDLYSDGDIENKILKLVKEGKSLEDLDAYEATFPVVYHLSDVRKNILIWYPFKENASVLEIGAGCGAITCGLCQRAEKVTAVELSMRRASINFERNKEFDNLEIIVGNLNDMQLFEKYDYVILNGVFEYAASFTEGNTPYETFLKNISSYLKSDGRILIAIENRLGAKYFAGAPEDHIDKHFVGINDYEGIDSVRTFSKEEIKDVCRNVGLVCNKFYYPYPDYKFPYEIFTDESINTQTYGRPMFQFSDNRLNIIDETTLNHALVKEQIADRFANSFLIEVTRQEIKDDCDIFYVKINTDRNKNFQIYTSIWTENGTKRVGKFPISEVSKAHIQHMKDFEQQNNGWHSLEGNIGQDGEIVYPFLERQSLNDVFASKVGEHDWEACRQIIASVYETFLADGAVCDYYHSEEFIKVFGANVIEKNLLCKKEISIDLILDNIFVSDSGYEVIDEEWVFPFEIPVSYVIWRVINECYHKYPRLYAFLNREEILGEYGIDHEMEKVFYKWEKSFAYEYVGSYKLAGYANEPIPFDDDQISMLTQVGLKSGTATKLYYDDGTGLSEEHTVYAQLAMNESGFKATFDLPKDVNIVSLRWDPLEKPCICSLADARTDKGDIIVKGANAISDYGRKKVFICADPYYEFQGDFGEAKEVTVEGQLEEISISMYQDIIADLNEQITQKDQYILYIHNSKLWVIYKAKDKTKEILRICKRKVKSALRHIKNLLRRKKNQPIENLLQVLEKNMVSEYAQESYDEPVDVIVPIYNGYEYLVELFPTLLATNMPARILLVDDQSTDPRVKELEREFAESHENVELLQNDRNYGFVYSVNHGLENSKNHVALVNTDTELPDGWLERLMAPIIRDEKVASSTPYTNSGTIFSFPNFCYNNAIYGGMSETEIDSVFRRFEPRYTTVPTGMGFCMGMNKNAIAEVGKLDYETFEKGYGEENDWCLRAEKLGYRNVQVENLFVYHKHGGSFPSEEKQQLIACHDEIIRNRYPKYFRSVNDYIQKDPNKDLRVLARMQLDMMNENTSSILAFDHMLGGGATSYLDRKVEEMVQQGDIFTVVRYDFEKNLFWLHLIIGSEEKKYQLNSMAELLRVSKYLHFDQIWINELVTYPDIPDTLHTIVELKEYHNAELIMLMHDYFSLCPSITFMGREDRYCGMPRGNTCASCWMERGYSNLFCCDSIEKWQSVWKEFMMQCTEVRSFSEDTLNRLEKTYGDGLKSTLVPHKVEYLFPVHKQYKTTSKLTIGLLGILCAHKGQGIVECMLQKIDREHLDVRIVLIGECEDARLLNYTAFYQTGRYSAEDLPKLVLENDIDIFFIPSVWPETFSYTTEEIMQMQMPVACFDLGAPASRVKKYGQGLVISKIDGEVALDEITGYISNKLLPRREENCGKQIVYIIESETFSSRYRIEHLREEMLAQGVWGEIWDVNHLPQTTQWTKIQTVVIYRCRDSEAIASFIRDAKSHQVRVVYDVDDLIFDYSMIEGLDFLKGKEYEDFQAYTEHIHGCMALCDAILVSTDTLANCASKSFPDKEIFVSRNMASTQMVILSNKAYRRRRKATDEVTLGYFSGSNTHNKDFDLIRGTLLSLLSQYDNLRIKVGGCIELGQEFWTYEDRIDREGFVDWRKLPEIVASVDINLMPLENTIFHASKSENKWMEAAFVGVPTIASYNVEMSNHTCDGKDILLCRTQSEWNTALEKMITDTEFREEIAENAHKRVMEEKLTITNKEELYQFIVKNKRG